MEPFVFRNRHGKLFEIARPEWAVSTTIRETGLIELLCAHGTGHPAPESVAWLDEHGPTGARGSWGVHGCCGCCEPAWPTHVLEMLAADYRKEAIENGDVDAAFEEGVAAERARIKRELIPEIRFSFANHVAARGGGVTTEALELAQMSVIDALNRVCVRSRPMDQPDNVTPTEQAFWEGRAEEKDHLRPLLKRCLADIEALSIGFPFVMPASFQDFRRELGVPEEEKMEREIQRWRWTATGMASVTTPDEGTVSYVRFYELAWAIKVERAKIQKKLIEAMSDWRRKRAGEQSERTIGADAALNAMLLALDDICPENPDARN